MRFAIAFLLILSTPVYAGSATLSWTPPTQNTDGTPLTDLTAYKLYWGESAGNYPNSVQVDDPNITTYVVDNLADGTWHFVATVINSAGTESAFSNRAVKTIAANPGLTAIDGVVYTIVKQRDRFVLLPAGTVPIGTQCDPGQSLNGRFAVPTDLVAWYGSVEPVVVVADCE